MGRFDPNSTDAMFATILAEMKADREDRAEFRAEVKERFDAGKVRMDQIHDQAVKTNGRVTKLEAFKQSIIVRVATITAVIGAVGGFISWAVSVGLHKLLLPLLR